MKEKPPGWEVAFRDQRWSKSLILQGEKLEQLFGMCTMCQTTLSTLHVLTHLTLTSLQGRQYCWPHLRDDGTESQ